MTDKLIFQLQKIGLDKKEAQVYLAVVELGSSPVQKIAQRANIPRATTYLVLDDLKEKGLVTIFQKGKKTYFSAASPDQLKELVRKKALAIKEQEDLVDSLASEISSRGQFNDSKERPVVRFYEGAEALRALIRDNLKEAEGEILGITSLDDTDALLSKAGFDKDDLMKRRQRKQISRRLIYTWRHSSSDEFNNSKDVLYIPYDEFPCKADITIAGDRVSFVPYDHPIRGLAVKDPTIAQNMRDIFELLWRSKIKKLS